MRIEGLSHLFRLEKQKSMSELRHLEYVLQKGIENLDSREAQISKQECNLERQKEESDKTRSALKDEVEAVESMKNDLRQSKQASKLQPPAQDVYVILVVLTAAYVSSVSAAFGYKNSVTVTSVFPVYSVPL